MARVTLQEIAKRANVSIATVSRTINCAPSVDRSLATRVRKIIEQVGYYPNTHARALVSGRSRIFGVMVSETVEPFFSEIMQTFEKLGFEHNYEIFLSSIARDPRRMEVAVRRMIERQVEGVAILSCEEETSLIEGLRRRNLLIVALDIESPEPPLKTICIDYKHGIRQAVQHLAALGHARVALITGPAGLRTAVARKTAFQECMNEIGLEIPPQLLVDGDHTLEAGLKALSNLAALPDRPSAVLCSNDMTAIGVMRGAFELGLNVPRDLSVVGFDDIPMAQFTTPPLTTVQMSYIEIANMAFRTLLDSVGVQCHGSSREVCAIRSNLVLRRSTDRAPRRLAKEAAGKRAQTALQKNPDDAELNSVMEDILCGRQDFSAAEPFLKKGLNTKPEQVAHGHALLGRVYAETNCAQDAIRELKLGMADDPDRQTPLSDRPSLLEARRQRFSEAGF